jgi:hypothetical protein
MVLFFCCSFGQTKKSRFFDFFVREDEERERRRRRRRRRRRTFAFFALKKTHTNFHIKRTAYKIKHVVLLKREEETKRRDDDDDDEEEKKSVNYVFFALSVRVWSHGGGFHDVSL